MIDESQTDALPRRRRVFNGVLGAALLAAGVFAALQAHTFWTARRGGQDNAERPGRKSPRGHTPSPADAPGAWADQPANVLSDARLAPLDGDPAGIAPPAGAKPLGAYRRAFAGYADELARYLVPGELAQAETHYRDCLSARGFQLTYRREMPDGRRVLVFSGPGCDVTVSLRNVSGQEKMVSVSLAATSREPPGDAGGKEPR
ncbi:MAG TPA: hypothetical protein DCX07_11045 [Phycisphaerales bacterium]|nr:hypothetical protein [Phycisphaerales bacterium]